MYRRGFSSRALIVSTEGQLERSRYRMLTSTAMIDVYGGCVNLCTCTTTTPRSCSMLSTNPSHILIARNSRGLNNPSASLSSPTETHAAAAGIFRSSGSPPWLLEECDNDEIVTELNLYESERAIEIDDTFTRRNGRFPGTVKIVVESTTFW